MKGPFIRNPYNYDTNAAGDESGLKCEDPSKTVQSERDETDINLIVKRFGVTGQLPQGKRMPTYGDFDQVSDYRTAHEMVVMAEDAFNSIDAKIRLRFNNNPQEYMDFCLDPKNLPELREMGLAPKLPERVPADEPPKEAPKEAVKG